VAVAAAAGGCSSSSSPATGSSADGGNDSGFVAGEPIAGLSQNKWTWVPIDGAKCRDGSSTGIGVNLGSASDKLMIFLEGGGACFNDVTCLTNPSSFGASDFTSFDGGEGHGGIFNRDDANNAVKDWNYVYVPYCTGDIHAGNNVSSADAGSSVSNQHVAPTFPNLSQVLLTGISAGGFGASANYAQVAKAFSGNTVALIDDSGPPMEDPYESKCQQEQVTALWGLDKTLLSDCGADCTNPATYYLDYAKHIGAHYPNAPFGLIEAAEDGVISLFFGFGYNNGADDCMGSVTTSEPGPTFTAGLQDVRAKLAGNPKFGSFIFPGSDHTSLITSFDTRTTDGVNLYDWVRQTIAGQASNVGYEGPGGTDVLPDAGSPAPDSGPAPEDAGPADTGTPDAAPDGGV
jgi:hypothetical protein